MPDEWPSNRSMARWVLPVLVGPSTAFTREGNPDMSHIYGRMTPLPSAARPQADAA
jgi:hypothetical protein